MKLPERIFRGFLFFHESTRHAKSSAKRAPGLQVRRREFIANASAAFAWLTGRRIDGKIEISYN